jgi:hypothetical protein
MSKKAFSNPLFWPRKGLGSFFMDYPDEPAASEVGLQKARAIHLLAQALAMLPDKARWKDDWGRLRGVDRPPPHARRGDCAALSVVRSIGEDTTICAADVAGSWLPFELASDLVRDRGLQAGSRFMLWISEDGSVLPQDIDTDVLQEPRLSPEEESERLELRRRSESRIQMRASTTEYKGDSP